MALTDNTEILKVINMNKMQHQYIQNLQKANMTLKCKIKEVSELKTEQDRQNYQSEILKKEDSEEEEPEIIEETIADDEFDLQELGTIEEMSYQKSLKKRRASRTKDQFYDRNSIGRSHSRKPKNIESKDDKDMKDGLNFYDKERKSSVHIYRDKSPEHQRKKDSWKYYNDQTDYYNKGYNDN